MILAAGRGRRLQNLTAEKPKPSIKVCGVPILLRNFLILKKLGFDVAVVVGYKSEIIKELLKGEKVEFVHNDNIDRGNAYSVLCAEKILKNENVFVVLMGDHIFSEEFLTAVRDLALSEKSSAAAHSPRMTAIVCDSDAALDIEEATKIRTEDGSVADIGKNIPDWTYIDTGAFICTPHVFNILERAFSKKEKVEWSEIVREARMKTHKINAFWADIDTVEDLKNAENEILKSLVKPEDGIISKYLNRKISLRISKWLCSYDISPNVITSISFILSIISAFFFMSHAFIPYSYVIGGIIAQISSVIDGVDGEIARLKMRTTGFGGFYDSVLDRYADVFILSSILFAVNYHFTHHLSHHEMLINISLFIAALTGASLVSYTASKFGEIYRDKIEKHEGIFRFIPAKRDERIFIIFVCAIFAEFNTIFLRIAFIAIAVSTNLRTLCRLFVARSEKLGRLQKQRHEI